MKPHESIDLYHIALKARFDRLRIQAQAKATGHAIRRAYHRSSEWTFRADTWAKAMDELDKLHNELTTQQ